MNAEPDYVRNRARGIPEQVYAEAPPAPKLKYDDMIVRMPRNAKAGDLVEFETLKGGKAQITVYRGQRH